MKVLLGILEEIWGLFVEDGSYAVAIVVWLLIVWFGIAKLSAENLKGPLMFAGLAAIMIENVRRSARAKR